MKMLKAILFLSFLGIILAGRQKRFLFDTDKNQFPNSPFGGGGSGGVSSPFGSGSGSGGVSSPFGQGGMSGTGGTTSYTPCVPSHAMCSLQCDHGYLKGPRGCDFCMCNSNAQSETTYGPVLIDPVDAKDSTTSASMLPQVSTQGPTASSKTTAVDCIAAKLSCTSTCGDKGYLVDPSDCTFCLCKGHLMI